MYGAERRGAPVAALTRVAHVPILERGAVMQSDLVVVADDTLRTEPVAQPLAGCDSHCEAALRHITHHDERLLVADFTALALELTQTLAGLSTAMAIAAAHMVGLSFEDSLDGLNAELDEVQLDPAQRHANLQLAQAMYALVRFWEPLQEGGGEVVVPLSLELDRRRRLG